MKRRMFAFIIGFSLILIIPPQMHSAIENTLPVTNVQQDRQLTAGTSTQPNENLSSDEIASGRMGSGGGGGGRPSRPSGGRPSRPSGGRPSRPPVRYPPGRQGGGYYPQPAPIYPAPFPSDYSVPPTPVYPDSMPEEPPVEITELPTFTLTNETPEVGIGKTITIKIPNIQAQQPVTIYWHFNGEEEWTTGGTTYQHTATQPGVVTITVVVQDADGLYSQSQSTSTVVTPSAAPRQEKYYQKMGTDDKQEPTPPETSPPKKPKKQPPKDQSTDESPEELLNLDPVFKQQQVRFKKELESNLSTLHVWERILKEDVKNRDYYATQLVRILGERQMGQDTPTATQESMEESLKVMNEFIKRDQGHINKTKAKIEELNSLLK